MVGFFSREIFIKPCTSKSCTILINASNLKKGGGLQVADSICILLNEYKQHQFVVVLSRYMISTGKN